ncbi:MAG: tripartite tricarboxylate transporter TctB family protein [Burkholderiales bacterium]
MSEHDKESGGAADDTPAASYRTIDAVTAVVIFAIGAVVAWDSYRIGAKWGSDGPEAGYFPFYIGLILCISSIVNFINALREKSFAEGGESFVSKSSLRMVFSVMIPTIIYVAANGGVGPVPGVGIYVASVIFIAVFMLWLGKYGWGKTLGVSIGVPVFFFLMFEIWFKVPLPKGPLEAMLGLD